MARTWQVKIATLFPEIFPGPLERSLPGKALQKNIWSLDVENIRRDKTNVDDHPFGGGAGMVLKPDAVDKTLMKIRHSSPHLPIIYMSPRGKTLSQKLCKELASGPGVILLCGRYEGIDQRVIDVHNVQEISIGDYILMGGEIPAMALIESCIRLLKGVVNKRDSLYEESFENGLLEHPHYTRPANWIGHKVPDVLLSGNHKKIKDWRKNESESITRTKRPDLWKSYIASIES